MTIQVSQPRLAKAVALVNRLKAKVASEVDVQLGLAPRGRYSLLGALVVGLQDAGHIFPKALAGVKLAGDAQPSTESQLAITGCPHTFTLE
jgi:hypothetical protein